MLEWRTEAHKGKSQTQLNDSFSTVVESVKATSTGGGRSKSKSRRASTAAGSSDDPATSVRGENQTGDSSADAQVNEPPRKRIRLQKSRRVVTERSA